MAINNKQHFDATPIPWKATIVILSVTIAEGMSVNMYSAFLVRMLVNQFGVADSNTGFYAGFFTAAYYLGQFLSNYPFGKMSDRVGRRPMILFALFINSLCQILFGVSAWLWWAVAIRFFNGLFNSNTPMVKCYVREISDETNQARIYGIRTSGYALGTIIGPLVSGIFSRPAEIPWLAATILSSGFFVKYPYFLSCFICSTINFICFLLAYFYLQETMKEKANDVCNPASKLLGSAKQINVLQTQDAIERITKEEEAKHEENHIDANVSSIDKFKTLGQEAYKSMKESPLLNRDVVLTISLYTLSAFFISAIVAVYPVWCSTYVSDHGLGLNEEKMGIVSGFGGLASLLFQLFVFAPVDKLVGTTVSFALANASFFPAVFLLPFIEFIVDRTIFMWISLLTLIGVFSIVVNWIYGTINLLVRLFFDFF